MKLWIAIITLTFTACAVEPATAPLLSAEAPEVDDEFETADDPGTCTPTDCTVCSDSGCVACNDYFEFSVNTPVATGAQKAVRGSATFTPTTQIAAAGPAVAVTILADGTAVATDAAGTVVSQLPGAAVKVHGQWVLTPAGEQFIKGLGRVIVRAAKCLGPIAALLLLAEAVNAGAEAALGDAAGQIGTRLQECKDKFAKIAAGIACLRNQPSTATCTDAVSACPDAFFGANTMATCGAEDGMQALVDALAAAIRSTSVKSGGAGYHQNQVGLIDSSIKDGTFATDPSKVCQMRDITGGCEMKPAPAPFGDAGYLEAKTCWDKADRGIWETKYEEAVKCCTTPSCRTALLPMKDC